MKFILPSLALCALAACSSLVPRIEAPSLSVVGITMDKGELWEQQLKVRIRVQNPNDRALPVRGVSCVLDVMDEEFARGESAQSFTVPALGEAEFDMNITANLASSLIKLMGPGKSLGDKVDYRLKGKISLSEGWLRTVPFDEQGTFKLR